MPVGLVTSGSASGSPVSPSHDVAGDTADDLGCAWKTSPESPPSIAAAALHHGDLRIRFEP
jgi:hypothetical protein